MKIFNKKTFLATSVMTLMLSTTVLLNGCGGASADTTNTIAGSVIGGAIGHQFGKGSGKNAATAAGAIVGGMVGSNYGKQQPYYR